MRLAIKTVLPNGGELDSKIKSFLKDLEVFGDNVDGMEKYAVARAKDFATGERKSGPKAPAPSLSTAAGGLSDEKWLEEEYGQGKSDDHARAQKIMAKML